MDVRGGAGVREPGVELGEGGRVELGAGEGVFGVLVCLGGGVGAGWGDCGVLGGGDVSVGKQEGRGGEGARVEVQMSLESLVVEAMVEVVRERRRGLSMERSIGDELRL